MRVIAYARVSTVEQAEGGISLEAQVAKMHAYAGLFDLETVETVLDPGESGKTLNRPGLQRALGLLKTGKADGLLIVKAGSAYPLHRRLARPDRRLLRRAGRQAASQRQRQHRHAHGRRPAGAERADNRRPVGAQTIGERTRDALQHKIKSHQRVGKVRFGYDLAADGVTLTDNPAEQQTVALMRDLRAAGCTLRQIAAALTQRGILTKEGHAQWQHQTVAYILRRAA